MKPEAGRDLELLRVYHGRAIPAQVDRIAAETRALRSRIPVDRQLLLHLLGGKGSAGEMSAALGGLGLRVREVEAGAVGGISAIRSALEEGRPRWVHAHGFQATLPAAAARWRAGGGPCRLIQEVHGATAFESFHRNRHRLDRFGRFAALYLLESLAAVLADELLLVSDGIARWYPAARLRPRTSIPRYVWDDGETEGAGRHPAVREVEAFVSGDGGTGRPTVAYAGSAADWQLAPETVRLMGAMIRRLGYRALVLTTEPDVFRELAAAEADVPGSAWMIREVPRAAVVPCLRRCDVGVLLREDRVLNRVACPTKLYQYLHAGLAVVTSPGVRAARPFLRDHGVGVELSSADLDRPEAAVTDAFARRLEEAVAAARSSGPGPERLTWRREGRERLFRLYGPGPGGAP